MELDRIEQEIKETSRLDTGSWRDLLNPQVKLATIFSVVFILLDQLSGINLITYYSPTIFRFAGFSRTESLLFTAIMGTITFFTILLATILVDRMGRRPILLTTIGGQIVSMALLAIVFLIGPSHAGMAVITVGSVILFHVAFTAGFGVLSWVYIPEMFSTRHRARGQAISRLANWVPQFIVTVSFLSVVHAIGASDTFWIFTAINVLALVLMIWMAPETRNKPLEVIEKYWANHMRWPASEGARFIKTDA